MIKLPAPFNPPVDEAIPIGNNIRIVRKDHDGSLFRNEGIPLSFVELEDSTIRICSEGWAEMAKLNGYSSLDSFFASKYGIRHISFSITHESIHLVLKQIENASSSKKLDSVSGAGELI